MSVPLPYYNSEEMKRTLGPDWLKSSGSQDQPLFKIPLENIIIDELHLVLRVTDRLEDGLNLEVIDRDELHCMFLTI